MAPVSDSVYFPPLGDCLTGERVLLSWRHVAIALSDATGQRQRSPALVEFLSDAYVQAFFDNPASIFTKSVNTAESDFQTKTAPINITTGPNDEFDINAVKEDAQWLSKNAKINLVAALRIAMVEFQSRASRHLCGPLSTQDATNLQEAAGLKNGQASSFLTDLGAGAALDAEEIWADFEKPDSRKRRIFETYLSERRCYMMAVDYCTSIRAYGYLPIHAATTTDLAELYRLKTSFKAGEALSTLLSSHLQPLGDALDLVEAGFSSVTDDAALTSEEVEFNWLATILAETVHSMSIVLQLADMYGDKFPPSNILSHWFGLMARVTFFEHIQPFTEQIAQLILPLQTLAVAATILLLKPTQALAYIAAREEDPSAIEDLTDVYFLSHEVLEHIHKPIDQAFDCNSQAATPVIWMWSLILRHMNISLQGRAEKRDSLMWQNSRDALDKQPQLPAQRAIGVRRNSAGSVFSIESSKYDAFLEGVGGKKDLELAEQLAQHATAEGKVFEVISTMVSSLGSTSRNSLSPLIGARIRATFLQVLKESYPYVGYRGESLSALLSVLSAGSDYWDISVQQRIPKAQDALAGMLRDEYMLNFYFEQAFTRYPYELMPFISLCRHLCDASGLADNDDGDVILNLLWKTPTLTLDLPMDISYEIVHEDEANIQFRLEDDVPLIGVFSSYKRHYSVDSAYLIPAGTLGRFMADTGRVVQLDFAHSTISLLGRRLDINLHPEGYECLGGMLQPEEVAEIISLLAALVRVDYLKTTQETASNALVAAENDILQEASKHISGGKDIVTVVCETMDHLLQNEAAFADESAILILNASMHFLDAILPSQPSRVWSYLARSELLNSDSRAGQLAKITGTLDLIASRFDLLNSAVRLFSRLIDTATASAVHRRVSGKGNGRQKAEANPWLGTADKVLSKVSYSIAQASVDIFENTSTWRFESEERRMLLLSGVVPILEKLIRFCCCMGDSSKPDNLAHALRPAALYVVECFVEPSTGTLRFQPLLSSLITAFTLPPSTLYPAQHQMLREEVISVIELSTAVLRVSDTLEQSSAIFETYLFKSCTLLARICAASDHFKTPTLWLLDALVVNGGKLKSEPPSLLGYLGPQTSKSFLQLLSTLGRPFSLDVEVKTTWKFFTSILKNRQQWMSNCLLTGQTPREAMKRDAKKNEMSKDSIFASALSKLGTMKSLDTSQALVILDFVTAAQNYWPWTVFTLQKDTRYIDGLREYVRSLQRWSSTAKTSNTQAAKEARIAAYIAEIFSMQLYHSRHLGKADELAKTLSADLDYYLRDGVEVAGYNKSLHNNFAKNFANKYTGCTLEDFKRSSFEPRDLGVNYFYDLDRADAMLRFDPGWHGRKSDGFKTEMELANANLSLVDAQISLFHAWEYLLIEMSNCLPSSETIAKQMIQVAQQCLDANQDLAGPESIFKKLVDSRADLALVLIQRLAKSGLVLSDVNQLLTTVVGTINTVEDPFSTDSVAYHRTLLKTLFVTLRAYQSGADNAAVEDVAGSAVAVAQTVLNVLDRVVGRGFRTLVSLIHDKDTQVVPEDLAILTAILQACLSLPSIEQSQSQISNIMASHDCVHAATSLYSWADKLTDRGDPVYGELSMLFVLELSTLPLLAEQLACDGILSSILSANLTKYMLKSQLSPYADAPVTQRCYGIWVKAILPLLLNLLTALGPTVAPEIAYVLDEFSHLLRLSVDRFEAPGASRTQSRSPHYITLLAASEAHSLALLTKIVASLRVNNTRDIAEVEYDADGLLENIEFWISSSKLLKERLMPLGQREMDWRGMKSVSGKGDNLLEAKLLAELESVRDVLSEELDAE